MDKQALDILFQNVASVSCLVVGDLMLDEYLWGKTERISPEAPVQVVDVIREELRLGGAGNVASSLAVLGAAVEVCSVVGDDRDGRSLYQMMASRALGCEGVLTDATRHTCRKTRVVAAHQQIVRIDRESRAPISPEQESQVCNWIRTNLDRFSVILLSDYGKGVLTQTVISSVIDLAEKLKIPVLVDPKGSDFAKYRRATILTPNRREAETASGISITSTESLQQAANAIMTYADIDHLLITRSEEGMSLFRRAGHSLHIPTVAREVFDVSGAGDTVLATLAIGLASGLQMEDAAWLANVAAGIAVGKLGTSTVSPAELTDAVSRQQGTGSGKIHDLALLKDIIAAERARGKRVVFTNGCFDLLHAGHVKYLQKARALGDLLVLGLNSDASVRRLKGDLRPLIGEDERAHIMAALDCIDYVVIFDLDTPLEVIRALRPDILAKGADYTIDGVVGRDEVESFGGRVELVTFVDGKSTTNIINRVLERYSNE